VGVAAVDLPDLSRSDFDPLDGVVVGVVELRDLPLVGFSMRLVEVEVGEVSLTGLALGVVLLLMLLFLLPVNSAPLECSTSLCATWPYLSKTQYGFRTPKIIHKQLW
jgi:hypothetical protein